MNTIFTRNSDTHPLNIDCVQPAGGWGLIGLSFCPGKKEFNARTGHWHRDLANDLTRIREWGAVMVISLIEEHEFGELQVKELPEMVEQLGMKWRHLPIRHRYPPAKRFETLWADARAEILSILNSGQRVLIHGNCGLGRTGTVAALLLVESGIASEEAVSSVRGARPNAIETALQEWHIMCHKPIWLSMISLVR